jgi:large subunit ribosomal protein L24
MKLKKNDLVRIISGNFKGKEGKIVSISYKKKNVYVENIGYSIKHLKPQTNRKYPKGGIIKKPHYINISNVMLMATSLNRPARCGFLFKNNIKYRKTVGKNIPTIIIK